MADTKISALPAGAALAGTEAFVAVQSGADVKTTPAALLTYVASTITLSAAAITSGTLALARGGTGTDLSATGGAGQVVKQSSAGGALTVATLPFSDIASKPTTVAGYGITDAVVVSDGAINLFNFANFH